jgi:hypothetical protein
LTNLLHLRNNDSAYIIGKQYMSYHLFSVFLFYLWFCALSFIQTVNELESVYKMGHYEGRKLDLHKYQHVNVPELGAEYYRKDNSFAPVLDYSHPYKKYMNENLNTRFNIGNGYRNVMARPVY